MSVTEETIDVAFSLHDTLDSYHEYLWVALASIFDHTDARLCVHILCDETLLPHARADIQALCDAHGQTLCFHDMTLDPRVDMRQVLLAGYSEGILYRLCLPELLSGVHKIIYLDADVLVQCDLRILWETPLDDCAAAGCWDPPGFGCRQEQLACSPEQYLAYWERVGRREYSINSGVLLLNLDKLRREHRLMEEAIAFWSTYGMRLPDQDALNYILHGQIRLLPQTMNLPARRMNSVQTGVIYHFIYADRPDQSLSPVDKLYLSYWARSPYYHPEYGTVEKAEYLRRMKAHLDVLLRLRDLGLWSCYDVLAAGVQMMTHRRFAEAVDCLCDDGLRLLPLERGGTERLQGKALALWEMERQSILESALEALGRQEEALVLCEKALAAFDPCAVLAAAEARRFQKIAIMLWNAAGRLRMALGDSDGAITAWRNCINMAPVRGTEYYSLDSVKRLIKCMLRRGNLDEAERYNNILSAMLPEEGMAAFNAVKIAFERKRQHRQTTDPVGSE